MQAVLEFCAGTDWLHDEKKTVTDGAL
jgi:hypothetical protein